MLNVIIVYFVLSCIFGTTPESRRIWRSIIDLMLIAWGIRVLLRIGMSLLPMVIVIALVIRVILPFLKGFVESFHRD